jgi:hypothetical protein
MSTLGFFPDMLIFKSVGEAFTELGMHRGTRLDSILVWQDRLKESGFKKVLPWQVINRIPGTPVLSRKTSFARLIERIRPHFPSLFTFVPKTFILPYMNCRFTKALSKGKKCYIVKPDNGSLGQGIVILEPGSDFAPDDTLVVAQEYVDSFLLDNTKFDLRVYALVMSVTPLRICVYRDGVARFCSESADKNTLFARLTNVAFNKGNSDIANISRLISEVLPIIQRVGGVAAAEIWDRIDRAIILSIMSAYAYLRKGEEWTCPPIGYSRCFQILGFDILLDPQLNPHVLEVNYRPSLEYHRGRERRMKVAMIRDAVLLCVPLRRAQCAQRVRQGAWDEESWASFAVREGFLDGIERDRELAMKSSGFQQVWPVGPGSPIASYEQVMKKVMELEIEALPGFKSPGNSVKSGEA